ncbi:MAG: class A beta-lactamase [Acidobacteriia bacterium]|nr:class A beta-lactamase [Terriglobia bacterium]
MAGKLAGCARRPAILLCVAAAALPVRVSAATGRHACAPTDLGARIEDVAREAHGPVGAAVMLVESGETVSSSGDRRFPMQSVYKLPIAMAVLHRVDRGTLSLGQTVGIRPEDLAAAQQHSPIRDAHPGGAELTVRELLRYMVSESDGTACDVLLDLVGGPRRVTQRLRDIGITGIVVATSEKEMGREPRAQFRNWATPLSALALLKSLHEGRGLAPASRSLLLELMARASTGPRRIKGLLPANTPVAHKTGSSSTIDGRTVATNDVGLVTLPDGRHLAVAVFVSDSTADEATRDGVIARIARAAWDCFSN